MLTSRIRESCWPLALGVVACGTVAAQEGRDSIESPRWSYEIRAGNYEPELETFATFYGDDKEDYYGLAGSYRFKDWLEVGAEYNRMTAKGVGLFTSSQALGGSVTYRLEPMHIFANFILQRVATQRAVPYMGFGLTVERYDQHVDRQGSIDGRTDLGYSARAGVRFMIRSRQPMPGAASGASPYTRSYVFVEAEEISAKVENIALGGRAYLLGIRVEFDYRDR